MRIKIKYPNNATVMISFVKTWWTINEFEKVWGLTFVYLTLMTSLCSNRHLKINFIISESAFWPFFFSFFSNTTAALNDKIPNFFSLSPKHGHQEEEESDSAFD